MRPWSDEYLKLLGVLQNRIDGILHGFRQFFHWRFASEPGKDFLAESTLPGWANLRILWNHTIVSRVNEYLAIDARDTFEPWAFLPGESGNANSRILSLIHI